MAAAPRLRARLRGRSRFGAAKARRVQLALAVACAALAAWQLGAAGLILAKAALAQHLLESAWSRTLAGERQAKPWPWADTWPVARLLVPARGIDLIVLAGASGRTLAFGPGHLDGTSLPGEMGVSVIGGHRDTHLAFLRDLAPGSEVAIERADGRRIAYRVAEARIADARTTAIDADAPGSRLALVTCYPFDAVVPGGPLRYVVFADPIAAPEAAALQ
jgi:sortase A